MNELNDSCKNCYCKYKEIFNEKMSEIMKKKKTKKIFYESSGSDSIDSSESTNESEANENIEQINNYSLITKLINRKNVNMNEIKEICKNEKIEICPYYLNRENIQKADIILLPYICILNEQIRNSLKININDNILIFDESQNIIENINDCNSNYIEYFQLYFCMLILNEYIKKYKTVLNNNNIIIIKQISIYCDLLISVFDKCEEELPNNSSPIKEKNMKINRYRYMENDTVNTLDSSKNKYGIEIGTDTSSGTITGIVVDSDKNINVGETEKEKKKCFSKILSINKFNILSKIDAMNLNTLSNFLQSSLFCRRIRVFAESFIHKNFKDLKNCPNFNTNSMTTAIYSLNEFTITLINASKYDYVYINDGTKGVDNNSEDGKEMDERERERNRDREKEEKKYNRKEDINKMKMMNISYIKNRKRAQTSNYNNKEEIKKSKKETIKKEENNKTDESISLFKKLFDSIIDNKKKNVMKRIEIISVSSFSNFQKIAKNCKNIILIGGTLYPLEEFLFLFLNEKKNKIKLFFADYIFKKEHIFSRIINKSIITNESIDNTYKNRYNKKHLLNLAIQIYILSLNTNFGNIIFFPSYKFLEVFKNFLSKEGNYVLEKMMNRKIVFFEKKNDNSILREYIKNIKIIKEQDPDRRIKNGCVLFCVMNAKLSEGINFHDEYCRNIIIVGIPFFKFENEDSKNFTLDRNALVLEYYKNYFKEMNASTEKSATLLKLEDINQMCKTYQIKYAMKIINQCIGRSMRHLNDFSSFFFLDFRFSKKEIYQNFPSFIKRHMDNLKEVSIEKNDFFFLRLKQHFTDTYNDFKNYYGAHFAHLKFEQVDENQLDLFVKDLYSLNQFHQRMNNI